MIHNRIFKTYHPEVNYFPLFTFSLIISSYLLFIGNDPFEILVEVKNPSASQAQQIEEKQFNCVINIGLPKLIYRCFPETRVQVNDVLISVDEVERFIEEEKKYLVPNDRDKLGVILNIDENVEMDMVYQIKSRLEKAQVQKIIYQTL